MTIYIKMKKLKLIIPLFFVMLFALNSDLHSEYKNISPNEMYELVPSTTRIVTSLAGNWEKSTNGVKWDNVRLPVSDENTGRVIYRRNIKISDEMPANYTFHLYFLGIDNSVEVFINDQLVSKYLGAMAPFWLRIPNRMISKGDNQLKLVVTPAEGTIGKIRNNQIAGSKIYTGVIREIIFVAAPNLWVNSVKYNTKLNEDYSSAQLIADVTVSSGQISNLGIKTQIEQGISDSATVTTEAVEVAKLSLSANLVYKATGDTVARSERKSLVIESERTVIEQLKLTVDSPKLWSPENPELYELIVNISHSQQVIDYYRQNVGFKDVKVKSAVGNPFVFLNNQPFTIKGVIYIEDYKDNYQTMTTEQMEEDVKLLKMLGANLVRFKYGLPHPYFLHLCDVYGILTMIEIPLYNVPCDLLALDEVQVYFENLSQRITTSYDSYISTYAFGISEALNESSDKYKEFSEKLSKVFKESTNKFLYKIVTFASKEIDTKGYDFIGFISYKNYTNLEFFKSELLRLKSLSENVPFFVNYGSFVQPDNSDGYSNPLSIEFQAYYIMNIYRIIEQIGGSGSVINSFNDYLLNSPTMLTNNPDSFIMTTGLFDRSRNHRLSFTTLQALFNAEREPLLSAGNFSNPTPLSFIVIGLVLVLILAFMLNRFRRFREYLFRSLLRPYNFYADIRDQRIMPNIQTLVLGIIIALSIGMYVASILYHFRMSENAEFIYRLFLPSPHIMHFLFNIVWMPEVSMFIFSIASIILVLIIALFIRMFAFFLRARIYFSDSAMMAVWSGIPLLIFLPVSILLNRILVLQEPLASYFLVFFVFVVLWTFTRLLKSLSVVFDRRAVTVYFIGILLMVFIVVIPLLYFELYYSIFAYLTYFVEVLLVF